MTKLRLFLLVILALGLFCRSYAFRSRFIYAHDSDLASWTVKDIAIDHHLRLIGQLTSTPGIFIGPLFYYALIPFYLATGMDPIGSVALPWIIGLASTISIYYVFSHLHNRKVGLIGSLIHAVSFGLSLNEREVVPTTPVMLWSVWFYFALHKLMSGDKKSLLLLAFLFALVWHINLALGLLALIVLIGLILKRNIYKLTDLVLPAVIFLILSLPLIAFEARHNYQQTRALFTTLSIVGSGKLGSPNLVSKFGKTVSYASKNVISIFWLDGKLSPYIALFLILGILWVRFKKPTYSLYLWIYAVWFLVYWLFFSLHPINLSEYYLNGLNILWLSMAAQILAWLMNFGKLTRIVSLFLIAGFLGVNLYLQLTAHYSKNGYIQKKAIVQAIKADAAARGFPCVSISYITDIGYNFGYRYFLYLAGLKTRPIGTKTPIYSIVFPLSIVDRVDLSFGDLGLIFPDYKRYSLETAKISCSGEDTNLTGPMFGFTK